MEIENNNARPELQYVRDAIPLLYINQYFRDATISTSFGTSLFTFNISRWHSGMRYPGDEINGLTSLWQLATKAATVLLPLLKRVVINI